MVMITENSTKQRRLESNDPEIIALAKLLKLPEHTRAFTLRCVAGEPVVLEVEMFRKPGDFGNVGLVFSRNYVLVSDHDVLVP